MSIMLILLMLLLKQFTHQSKFRHSHQIDQSYLRHVSYKLVFVFHGVHNFRSQLQRIKLQHQLNNNIISSNTECTNKYNNRNKPKQMHIYQQILWTSIGYGTKELIGSDPHVTKSYLHLFVQFCEEVFKYATTCSVYPLWRKMGRKYN